MQSRLITELKLANIKTIEAANEFLKTYVINHNNKFALPHNLSTSVFTEQLIPQIINQILAILTTRKIDNGNCIKFNHKYYQPYKDGKLICFKTKTECLVIECFDKQLLGSIEEEMYELWELPTHKIYSNNFDFDSIKPKKEKKVYIPPMTHSFKTKSWNKYQMSQKNKIKNYVNV